MVKTMDVLTQDGNRKPKTSNSCFLPYWSMTLMISKQKLMEGTVEEKVRYLRIPYNRLNPLHEAEMLQEILDTVPEVMTQRDLSKYLNWPESTVSIHLKLLKDLDPVIKKHLNETDTTLTAFDLYEISRLDKAAQLSRFVPITENE